MGARRGCAPAFQGVRAGGARRGCAPGCAPGISGGPRWATQGPESLEIRPWARLGRKCHFRVRAGCAPGCAPGPKQVVEAHWSHTQ